MVIRARAGLVQNFDVISLAGLEREPGGSLVRLKIPLTRGVVVPLVTNARRTLLTGSPSLEIQSSAELLAAIQK